MKRLSFDQKCYQQLKRIPRGKVTTYADIAHSLGSEAYRAVGNAMNRNPFAPRVPCHRVVKSNGEIGGYAGGTRKKIALLKKEGLEIKQGKVVDFEGRRFTFK